MTRHNVKTTSDFTSANDWNLLVKRETNRSQTNKFNVLSLLRQR